MSTAERHCAEPSMDEGVEGMLLRRVHDGEVIRVGDRYLWRSPFDHLRSYCHEPLEILVVLGLLIDTDTGSSAVVRVLTDAGPVSGMRRAVVLTGTEVTRPMPRYRHLDHHSAGWSRDQ
ncbi:MAG: hypothetical protein ACRDTF_21870 [Pseudonocardiaceae bacterium]